MCSLTGEAFVTEYMHYLVSDPASARQRRYMYDMVQKIEDGGVPRVSPDEALHEHNIPTCAVAVPERAAMRFFRAS